MKTSRYPARGAKADQTPPYPDRTPPDDQRTVEVRSPLVVDFEPVMAQILSGQAMAEDPEQGRILDSARAEFVAHGFRRAAVADIARRANVSRQTLHRRCGDKDEIISAVILREVLDFFLQTGSRVQPGLTTEEQVVELFTLGMQACQQNPLVKAIKEYEPELISLQNWFDDESEGYRTLRKLLALRLAPERTEAAERVVELTLRITATLLLAPTTILPVDTEDQTRAFARTYFLPILAASFAQDED